MSRHQVAQDLSAGHFPEEGTAIYVPALGGPLLAWGETVPTDGDDGYAPGCIFIHTDASPPVFYLNQGTAASCDFDLNTTA